MSDSDSITGPDGDQQTMDPTNTGVSVPTAEDVLRRICAEYTEMPGLRVTHQQAQRLWGLDAEVCLLALEGLVEAGFLCKTPSGQYTRLTEGPTPLPALRMAKAVLERHTARRCAV